VLLHVQYFPIVISYNYHEHISIRRMEDNIDQQKPGHPQHLTDERGASEQQQQDQIIIPVIEEEYSISKETTVKEAKIEKRWVTKTKTVKVPITYEEVYINGKKMRLAEENSVFSLLKDKLSSSIDSSSDKSVKLSVIKKGDLKDGELVPLFPSSDSNASETEKVIPLLGEEFEINKKMVKLAEIVIRKKRVTEKNKIGIDIRKEEVKIKYPDGKTEEL
jgi:stress response protein YsnF